MSNVKLKKDKQSKIKGLSKAIYILALIGKIVVYIAAPCIILTMILMPILFSKIEVNGDTITINGKTSFDIVEEENSLTLKYKDETFAIENDVEAIKEIKEFIQSNSKSRVIAYVEITFAASLVLLGLMYMVLRHLQKLFKNIHDEDTPFTLENANHIKRIAYYLIAAAVVPYIFTIVFEILFKKDLNVELSAVGLMQILFLFSMSYIFEYGYEIQHNSKAKMYGDIDE